MKSLWKLALFVLVLMVSVPMMAAAASESWPVPANLQEYKVTRVIDGDTIVVEKLGKVRYIGVNAPEIKHGDQPGQPFGVEATTANKKLVLGKKVKLEYDLGRRDKYGRLLAYVYVGKTFVNARLVEMGYAQVMTVPPNVKYQSRFIQLQKDARDNFRGLWETPPAQGQGNLAIQAYWGNLKTHRFHYPWCKEAKRTNPDNLQLYQNRADAIEAGLSPCKKCKP
ncbi:MAG TPA: thermonuclease family protein [Bacillota bacterium]|nr:thermonuclease family protein [Bacillota bacterium]